MKELKKNQYILLNYILKCIPKFIKKNVNLKKINNDIVITTREENLILLLNFLKNNFFLQFKTLISITAVDYPEKSDRFELNYFLLSYKLNLRLIIKITTSDIHPVKSVTSLYNSAN